MMNEYSMSEAVGVAKIAANDIESFLRSNPKTIEVENVEDDEEYREKDIDLIWTWERDGKKKITYIEIKGDRYYRTGNYFLETVSNKSKGTPGCFLYTEANYVFYYFVDEKELHILPMPGVREWFLNNINHFEERETSTFVSNGEHYVTVGRLVNRELLQKNVSGAKIININNPEFKLN